MSEKYIGLVLAVFGALLLVLTFVWDKSYELVGGICLAGGGLLLVRGLRQARGQERAASATVALGGHEKDIDRLLEEGRSLAEIALDCQRRFGVSADLMLLVATFRLREWLTSGEPRLREIAERTVAAQARDGAPPPEQVLGRLHEDGVALHQDETVTAFVMPPSLRDGLKGALVLTSSYLFFLVRKDSGDEGLADVFRDLPVIGHGVVAVDILQGVAEQYKNPFTEKRARKLAERFKLPGSFAIPLGKVRRTSVTTTFAPRSCLEIEWAGGEGGLERRWFDTTLREQPFMNEPQPETWVGRWTDRLRLIALAAGNDLSSGAGDRNGKYTLTAGTRTAAHGGDDFVRPSASHALLRMLGMFVGGLALVALLGWVIAVAFSPVVAVVVFLGGLVLFLLAVALSSRWTGRPGAPRGLDALRAQGGLARLAEQTHGRHVARGRLAAAQAIVKAAQSGEVADRRDARLIALAQGTDGIEPPEEFIRRLDPDRNVYFPALPATLQGDVEARVEGALVLTTRYLFFLEGGKDLRPVERADGGFVFDAETITRVESLFRAKHSLAIAMRAVTRLEMTEDEHPELVLQADAVGGGPERTLRWRLGDERPEVEVGKIALWLTRVQPRAPPRGTCSSGASHNPGWTPCLCPSRRGLMRAKEGALRA